jgi:hypothetical protein
MKRLTVTQQSVRCPFENRTANLAVRTDPGGYPSRRYLEVASCSLLPSASFVPGTRKAYFSDVAPPVSYASEVDFTPRHAFGVACPRRCLSVLNAAESGAADPKRCTAPSGDSLELARQTQNPAIMQLVWRYGF